MLRGLFLGITSIVRSEITKRPRYSCFGRNIAALITLTKVLGNNVMNRRIFKKIAVALLSIWLMLGETVGVYGVNAAELNTTSVSGNDVGGGSVEDTVSGNDLDNILTRNTEAPVIKKGIPVLDGIVDDMYKSSLTLDVGVGENSYGTEWSDDHGKVYLLYSDHYLYICADIIDDSVVSAGEIYVSGSNPYNNDNCEFRLSLNGGTDTIKVGIDAYGLRAYGLAADEKKIDYSKILYKTTYNDSVDNSGYVIEAAIPCTEGILDMHTAGKLGFKIQLNDLDANGTMRAFATDYAGEGTKGLVYYGLSTEVVSGEDTDWSSDENLGGSGSDDATEEVNYKKLSFGTVDGNYIILNNSNNGNAKINKTDGTADITYGNFNDTNVNETHKYVLTAKFETASDYDADYKYLRVLYSADNPDGEESVNMKIRTPKAGWETPSIDSVEDTNGEFVLSPSVELPDRITVDRLEAGNQIQLAFETNVEGGSYKVKALYFFKSAEDANAFTVSMEAPETVSIKINGNDIANYKIVVPENGFGNETECVAVLQQKIKDLCGVELPVVSDRTEVTEYEILIGNTNRAESDAYYGTGGRYNPSNPKFSTAEYRIDRVGNKVVVAAAMASGIEEAIDLFAWKLSNTESPIDLTKEKIGSGTFIFTPTEWSEVTNVENPVHFEDDFTADEGYWSKDSDKAAWSITTDGDNKVFSNGDNANALSYLHVFEKNVSFETKWKYTAENDGSMNLLLRYTADDAYVKVGYDFAAGEWFIDSREGKDFLGYRLAAQDALLTAGQWYTLKAVVDGTKAELYVDDTKVLETSAISQLTPGRIGGLAENASVQIDDVSIYLLSGQGSIMRNVVHTKLPDDVYREGGSVVEMQDGTWNYLVFNAQGNAYFKSTDNGQTWERTEEWVYLNTCPQILRLNDGKLMQIIRDKVDGVDHHVVRLSEDDGATWTNVGAVRKTKYDDSTTIGGYNMNDKLTQMSDGRIFYSICYDAKSAPINGQKVFCEIFYSDDNGVTWTKSETDSFEIEGNENIEYFGECKILETSEGTLRMYNSYNTFGCIVYSESTDNGVTWGPIQKMEEYTCSCSSMQFVKDPYASNDTTYYMVWVQDDSNEIVTGYNIMPRAHLALAKTTDGINWVDLGDIWRWENRYSNIAHLVDPFIQVTEEYIIAGSGISEETDFDTPHHAQRQHIYAINKYTLEELAIVADATDESYKLGTNETAVIYCTGYLNDFTSVEMDGVTVDSSDYTLEEGSTVLTFKAAYMETLAVGEHTVTLNYSKAGSIDTSLTVLANDGGNEGGNTGGNEGGNTGGNANEKPGGNNGGSTGGNEGGNTGGNNSGNTNKNNAEQSDSSSSNVNKTVTNQQSVGVNTGDNSNIYYWIILLFAAVVAVVIIFMTKKKRNN